jgi:PKD repeat protein
MNLKSKPVLFVLMMFQLNTLKAQQPISIVSTDMPVVGNNIVTLKDTSPIGITPGVKGANIMWDFSSLTPDVRDTAKCMQPSATPYGSTFNSNSNLAITSNDTNYLFFNNSTQAFKITGGAIWIDTIQSTVATTFNPAADLYRFPTEYNGNFTGTYAFTQQISLNGTPIRVEYTSNYADTIDAWGIVQTPLGYYESLRQKRMERTRTIISAQIFPLVWTQVSDTRDTTTDYNWLAKETKLAVVDFEYDSNKVLSGVTYSNLAPKPIARFTYTNNGPTYQFTNTTYNTNGTTYSWNFGDGSATTSQTNPSHTYAQGGQYQVCLTATNSVGSSTYCETITVAAVCPTITANAASTNAACNTSDGTASVNPSGGATPYSYSWSNNATSASISNLAAGSYSVTITDNNGCSITATVNVSNAGAPTITVNNVDDVLCNGDNDGAISISVSGGATPYDYEWSNASTTDDITNLLAGTYTVSVTDDNNCLAVQTVTVSEPTLLQVSADNITNTTGGNSNGAIAITATGGTPSYSYDWSNGSTLEDISGLSCGNYGVTVRDDNGCTAIGTYFVDCSVSVIDMVENHFSIMPNPTTGKVFIEAATSNAYQIEVMNSMGVILHSENVFGNSTIDLTEQSKGIYFISITNANSDKIMKRIALQ